MQSKAISDNGWGAFLAAEIPDASLHEALISELSSATDRYYRAVLFDAIIRSQTIVPTDLLLTFGPEARDIVLILLARNPAAETEAPLLAILDGKQLSREQWTLVSNLLFRIDAKLLARKTLQQLTITHTLVLHSPNSGVVGGGARDAPKATACQTAGLKVFPRSSIIR